MTLEKFIAEMKEIIERKEIMVTVTADGLLLASRVSTDVVDIATTPNLISIIMRATAVSFPPTAEITAKENRYCITFSNIVIDIEVF